VYRYILVARRRELVPLVEELEFVRQYAGLLKIRFQNSLNIELPNAGYRANTWYIAPISLQILLENAVKHNEHSPEHPLAIKVTFDEAGVRVSNEKRARASAPHKAGVGLRSLEERCRLVLDRGIEVENSDGCFVVTVPVRTS
jgi:LytS/YehU family sensor histidine kinase